MIFYHIMMQKYGSQVFRDLKLDRCTDYLQNTLCGCFWEDFLIKMSFVWNSYRRLALLRHLAGVFPNVYKRSGCVKMSPRTEFPFNETARRHLVNGAIRQRLVTFRRRFREAHKNEKALKVIFRGTGKKKNTFCWLSVCALRDDWLIYNVVILFIYFFWTAAPSASLRASKDNAHHQGRVAYEQKGQTEHKHDKTCPYMEM